MLRRRQAMIARPAQKRLPISLGSVSSVNIDGRQQQLQTFFSRYLLGEESKNPFTKQGHTAGDRACRARHNIVKPSAHRWWPLVAGCDGHTPRFEEPQT